MSCEGLVDVGDFGVVVFGVSVGVLAVLVDDFVGFLEDFGAGGGVFFLFVGHGRFSLSGGGLLGVFSKKIWRAFLCFGDCCFGEEFVEDFCFFLL